MLSTGRFFILGIALSAAGCSTSPSSEIGKEQNALQERLLMDADRAFAAETAAKGVDGWVSFFAPDGTMVPNGSPAIKGTDAIRKAMEAALSNPDYALDWDPKYARVSKDGQMGFTVGRYTSSDSSQDPPANSEGRYLTIWEKQEDGQWKVVFDMGNTGEGEVGG
jgi:uncharacterized protein (TIGR02246 family)